MLIKSTGGEVFFGRCCSSLSTFSSEIIFLQISLAERFSVGLCSISSIFADAGFLLVPIFVFIGAIGDSLDA